MNDLPISACQDALIAVSARCAALCAAESLSETNLIPLFFCHPTSFPSFQKETYPLKDSPASYTSSELSTRKTQ